jgi:CO/xanthine dehydrogenase FAD-binding subunit
MLAAGDDARLIAGGQTLVPLMAMRLARPKRLIDIARITELAFVRGEPDAVVVGATTKQCVLERDPVIRTQVPLLAKAMPFVGHAAIRARGTIGGSLANADPAAEIALAAVILDAIIVYRDGDRDVQTRASDFLTGPMMTVLSPSACLICVRFPIWREARIGVGFHEVSARRSDFAFASAGAQIALDANGACQRVSLGIGAVTSVPLRLDTLARTLEGREGHAFEGGAAEQSKLREAVAAALAEIEPLSDLHASADYRRRAAITLLMRAIADAYRAAKGRAIGAH